MTLYPYYFTRSTYIKQRLLKKEDYHKLLKMNWNEIVRFLQEESDYQEGISQLALELKGADLIEAALNKSLVDFFSHVRRFVDQEIRAVLDVYLTRWDFYNVKTALRLVFNKTYPKESAHLFIPAGVRDLRHYLELAKSGSVDELIKKTAIIPEELKTKLIARYESSPHIHHIENALDKHYFTRTFIQSKKIEEPVLSKFLHDEAVFFNIKTVLSLRQEGLKDQEIEEHLIPLTSAIMQVLKSLVRAEDLKAAVAILSKTNYASFLAEEEITSVLDLELALTNHLYKRYTQSVYQNPDSIVPMLSILFTKEAEVSNLKGLVKAKQLELDPGFIEKRVITQCWR